MDAARLASLTGEPTGLDVARAAALFNESLMYLRLASDHMKFIRNFFDETQELLYRGADGLAQQLDALRNELCGLSEPLRPAEVFAFVRQATPVVQAVINFKNRVADAIDACTTQQLLPADFSRHLRRETNQPEQRLA